MTVLNVNIQIPEVFEDFLAPNRYKIAYGGRGGAKTESFARILIAESLQQHHINLCCREIQKSIKKSTKATIEAVMNDMGVLGNDKFFRNTETRIFSPYNRSEFLFEGLWQNADHIKSIKGITRCLVDEAQKVRKKSLKDLTPCIREPGSQILMSFNPDKATDPVYRMFVESDDGAPAIVPPNTLVKKINYDQNPWFCETELYDDMMFDRANDYEKYLNVWEGELDTISEAIVFSKRFVVDEFELPEDSPFLYGADWGFSQDPTCLLRCLVDEKNRKIYVDYEASGVGVEMENIPDLFDKVPGSRKHKIRADSARPETISYVRRKKFMVVGVEKGKGSVEDGIEFLKNFIIVVHPRCKHLIKELRNYSYKVNNLSGDITSILVDAWNHLIDALRYACQPLIRNRRILRIR